MTTNAIVINFNNTNMYLKKNTSNKLNWKDDEYYVLKL